MFITIILLVVVTIFGFILQMRLKSKFAQYSKVSLSNGMSGKEIAESMLKYYHIYDVNINSVEGSLTDHYDPSKKTVNLSPDVYNGRSVASAAVAAHECGHAVQHAEGYEMLKLRSGFVPTLQLTSGLQNFLVIALMFTLHTVFGKPIIGLIVLISAINAVFALITLPVEFNASNQALAWLETSGKMRVEEQAGAKDALWWAAMTYVVAATASLVSLAYWIMQYNRR